MKTKIIFSVLICSLFCNLTNAQSKTTLTSGTWTNPAIWSPTGVPTSTNDVTISAGHTITISGNAACSNLTVGNGATTSQVHFIGNTARTFSVNNNLTITSLGTFSVASNSNVTHTLFLGGNLINSGVFRLFQDANSLCNIVFNKNGNQTISGNGSLTRFNRIILNMGTSVNNVLEVTSTSFTTITNFLTLSNGTFKLSTPNAATVVPFTAATTIQATSGIWLNSPTAVMSFSANLGLSGLLRISSGYMDVGNANNEDLSPNGGTLTVEGGTVDIAGKYNANAAATTFSFTGGTILITNNASTNTTLSPFNLTAVGSSFNMSGGTMILRREGGTGAQDLGFTNTGSTSGSVTGGTIQLGYTNTPANQTISVNSSFLLPNIVVASASVTLKVLTNSLSVLNNITVSSGTINANNLGISLGGNWNNAGRFIPGTGTVTLNGNTAQSIFKSGGESFNHLAFSGTSVKSISSAVTASGNITISSGSTVDVSASNYSLNLRGNFVNNGSFNGRNGLLSLVGVSSQSIGGTSTSSFYDLTLNNAAGALIGNSVNLLGTLLLSNGNFNTNSQVFTLVSDASGTARIGSIAASGNITGNVTIQRFIPGGTTGWVYLGAPISSALTLNDWDDDLFVSCPTCPDGSANGFYSVYTYDETQSGAYDVANSYVALSGINDAIQPNKGYWVYVGTSSVTTSSIIVDVTGAVRKNNQTINLNYTNTGSVNDDGWNLIQNPYPSAISWTALRGATSNIDNAIYVYNADLNSGAGGTAAFVNGVSSPAVASGGIGDNIPMCQGFYVHSTGATALNALETNKVNANPTFLRPSAASAPQIIRLNLLGPNSYSDEAALYFEPGSNIGFEEAFDAYKVKPNDPLAAFIAITSGTVDFQINAVSPLNGTLIVPVKANTGTSGNFTISASGLSDLPAGTCVILYDKWNSTSTDLRAGNYAFTLPDTTTVPRFELHLTLNPLNINVAVHQPNCQMPNNGVIVAKGLHSGPWNYTWKNNAGAVIKTSLGLNSADTLKNLSGGNYELQINSVGGCDNNTSQHTILAQVPVTANFIGIDTLFLAQTSSIQFTNTSVNAINSFWHSGVANTTSNSYDAGFSYNQAGNYLVKLISTSSSGCTDSIQKQLVVIDNLTGIEQIELSSEVKVKTLGNNAYTVELNLRAKSDSQFLLLDCNGALLQIFENGNHTKVSQDIDLSVYPAGVYFLRLKSVECDKTIKLIAY